MKHKIKSNHTGMVRAATRYNLSAGAIAFYQPSTDIYLYKSEVLAPQFVFVLDIHTHTAAVRLRSGEECLISFDDLLLIKASSNEAHFYCACCGEVYSQLSKSDLDSPCCPKCKQTSTVHLITPNMKGVQEQ